MKREDLKRAIDTIAPSGALRARVLALPARPRARLENLRPVLSLGAAALMCAGVVYAVLAIQNMAVPGSDNAGFNALSGGTEALETTAAPEKQAPEETPAAGNAQSDRLSEIGSPMPAEKQDAARLAIPIPENYHEMIAAMQPGAFGEVKTKEQFTSIAKQVLQTYYGENKFQTSYTDDTSTVYLHDIKKTGEGKNAEWDLIGERNLGDADILVYSMAISAETGAILHISVMEDFGLIPSTEKVPPTDEQNRRWTQATLDYLNDHGLIQGQEVLKTMLQPTVILDESGRYYASLWVFLGNGLLVRVHLYDNDGKIDVVSVNYSTGWKTQTPDATQTPCPTPNSGGGLDTPRPPDDCSAGRRL